MNEVRRFLDREIPEKVREEMCADYDIDLVEGDTYFDAMMKRAQSLAREKAEFAELLKQMGIEVNEKVSHMDP